MNIVERLKSRAAPLTRARELSPTAELCREAAARIEALEAALRLIANGHWSFELRDVTKIARAALAPEQDK